MTGGDLLMECLKAQEVRRVFGMPGTQNIHIYDALYRRGERGGRHPSPATSKPCLHHIVVC